MDIGWPVCLFTSAPGTNTTQESKTGQREKLGLVVFPTKASAHPVGKSGVGVTFGLFLVRARGP